MRFIRPLIITVTAVLLLAVWIDKRIPTVEVVRPEENLIVESIVASGQVHGQQESSIGAENGGRVSTLFVREGDRVKSGQLLAYLDSRVLKAQELEARESLNVAYAQLRQASRRALPSEIERVRAQSIESIAVARARLAQARQRLSELRRGSTPEAKLQAWGQLQQADARLVQATTDLKRQRSLFQDGRMPIAALEQSQSAERVATEAESQANQQLILARRDLERERQRYQSNSREELDEAEMNFQVMQESLGQAEAELVLARQEVLRQQRLYDGGAAPRASLDRAEATLNSAVKAVALNTAKRDKSGLDLKRQQQLFQEQSVPRAALERAQTAFQVATSAVGQAQVQRQQAKRDLLREQQLYTANRRVELDHAQAAYDIARGEVSAARAHFRDIQLGTRKEVLSQAVEEIKAARSAFIGAQTSGPAQIRTLLAQPRLEDVALAQTRVQEAQRVLDVTRERLRATIITSPFEGTITHLITEVGGVASPAQPILKLVRSGKPEIRVDIDETNLGRLRVGQRAIVSSNAFSGVTFEAYLHQIGAEIERERGTVEIRLRPVSAPKWLRSGQTLNVNLIVNEGRRLLTIPLTSVESRGGQASVLIVQKGTVVRRNINTAPGTTINIPVVSGLSKSDFVIVSPSGLTPGQKVRPNISGAPNHQLPEAKKSALKSSSGV